ncbi:glucose-induced degradation protein 4 homolog isoform X2 [Gorilla gorilla gorilla]|uniref:glucose-induced degradation protein 4 homolog isoform X2 n=1 Tax=Gorilla gorilla gorilla TaxID=9595 RepID=UPI00123E74D7|nr:glucose-induced degradation protein 4 homolog isoform X3 [Gorilla gorilla gorilla]
MCARGQVGRGTQLRTGRPCSQVPGSRWRPERLLRRQRAGGRPSRPHPARARPGLSLPATLLGSRAAAAVPLPLPPALAPGDPAMPVRTECPPPAGASAASAASLIPPPPINTQQPGVATSLLYSGSKFRGHQKSKGNSYDVEVVLQHVDTGNSYLCGYLKIKGLTEEYPTLTTFFEGEIISKKHPFLTRKWDADEDVDRKHWGKFLAFYQYAKSFNSDDFDYEELKNGDYVFMRWKYIEYSRSTWTLFRSQAETPRARHHPASQGTVSGPRSHDQRHQWCFFCRVLLHLLSEVSSLHRGLLLP